MSVQVPLSLCMCPCLCPGAPVSAWVHLCLCRHLCQCAGVPVSVQAAVRAMDAMQEFVKSETNDDIVQFMVAGESKVSMLV